MIGQGETLLQETRATAQAGVVAQVVQGRLRSGWSINRANARLARQAAGERPVARRPQEAESVQSAEGRDQAQIAASLLSRQNPHSNPRRRRPPVAWRACRRRWRRGCGGWG